MFWKLTIKDDIFKHHLLTARAKGLFFRADNEKYEEKIKWKILLSIIVRNNARCYVNQDKCSCPFNILDSFDGWTNKRRTEYTEQEKTETFPIWAMGNGHFSVWERCCMHSIVFFSPVFADNAKLFVRCSIVNCVLKHETHSTKTFVIVNRSRWPPLPFVLITLSKNVFSFFSLIRLIIIIIFNSLRSKDDQTVWHFSFFL